MGTIRRSFFPPKGPRTPFEQPPPRIVSIPDFWLPGSGTIRGGGGNPLIPKTAISQKNPTPPNLVFANTVKSKNRNSICTPMKCVISHPASGFLEANEVWESRSPREFLRMHFLPHCTWSRIAEIGLWPTIKITCGPLIIDYTVRLQMADRAGFFLCTYKHWIFSSFSFGLQCWKGTMKDLP